MERQAKKEEEQWYNRLDGGLSAVDPFFQGERGEERRGGVVNCNELDSLHSPLPPEPGRYVIYGEDRGSVGLKRHD